MLKVFFRSEQVAADLDNARRRFDDQALDKLRLLLEIQRDRRQNATVAEPTGGQLHHRVSAWPIRLGGGDSSLHLALTFNDVESMSRSKKSALEQEEI